MDNWSTYGIDKLMMTDYSKGVSSEPLKEVKYYECGECKQKVSRDAWPSLDKWWAYHEKYCPGPAATVVSSTRYPEFDLKLKSSAPVEGSVRVYKEFSDRSLEGEIFYKGRWLPFRSVVESELRGSTYYTLQESRNKRLDWEREFSINYNTKQMYEHYNKVMEEMWRLNTKPKAITVPRLSSQVLSDVRVIAKETKS